MPASWETPQTVLCAVLHVDVTTVAWSFGLKNLQVPGRVIGLTGMPFDMARNEAARAALQSGADWLFFLDSDVVPPPDAIHRLISRQQPIISGVYHRRSPPHGVPVMLRGAAWVTEYPPNAVIEVDLVGAGCLLIHRSVLERLPPVKPGRHWFSWQVDLRDHLPPGEGLSEDFVFNLHARRHGYKILVDTGVQCKHIGYAQATYNSFVPLEHGAA